MKKLLHKSLRLLLWFAMLGFVAPLSVVAADCYIAGSFNGWNASATKLTQNGDQYELTQKFDGGTQFKIVYNGNWYGYDAVKGGTDLVTSADGSNKNIQFNSTECYGLFFKNNGELYITKRDDCPQAYSLWGFDILYQEGDTKKWASTKGSAEAWDGNFISTSGDNEVYDMGVIKRGARFIGFRFYTNENGSSVDGANVIWKNLTDEHDAIEGSNYGKWSSNGSQSGTHGGTDEVWHETGCKNKFLGYDNGTYSFYLIFELKVNGSEKALVRTITVNYTINEFDLITDLQGPAYVGDVVNLTVSGGTAPYTWQQSDDEVSWSTLSGASGTTYAHKVVDKTFIRVVDADGKITNVVEIAPSIKCDPANTIVVFKEDFGTLPDVDARASYSKQNVAVPGTTITYSASVPYTAETTSCAAMTNEGYYSVLANPRNAGCGTNVAQGVTNCNCYDSSERWYRITEDHTPGDTNGGMLMYNCADGTSKTDVLYECTIDGICANTYINFSAFVTCANTGRSGNIPIEAEFKLFNADTGAELSTSPVTNIGLSEEWKEISAMFNSADATRVKIQLINKADAGQGNDLLFDDMMLSVCTPEADLVCSDLTSTEKTIVRGESETLTAEILSGIMSNPFYLWQYRTNKSNWLPLGDPQQNLEKLTVTPETTPTYYRVILANTAQEALNIAGEGNPSACGMYAITNNVTLYAANLNLTANLVDGNICADGVDANTYTLTVTNTTGTAVNNVKVNVSIPAQWVNLVSVASGSGYANGVWTIGKMNESETKTLTLTLKSDIDLTNLSETATLQAFVSQLESATWTTYAASLFKASNNITVVAQTQVPTDVTPYDACTTPGTLVYADLVKVAHPENLTFYETATSTTPVESMSTNSAVSKYVYFTYTEDGKCASDRGKVKISISAQPTAQITSSEIQRVCAKEKYTFTISANAANGYGSWSIVSGEASIANPDALTTTACVVAGQTAVLAWNVVNEKNCKATATTTLIVDKEPEVTIVDGKGSQKACGPTEFKVAVNPNVPVGSWQIVSGTATIVSPTNYETKITGVGDNKTVKVRYETGAYGQCASVKGPEISLTVNALPTAAFTTSSSVICASTADPTKAQVTFTGASPYELTYQVDEGTAITKTGLTSPYTIKEQMSASGTLQLVSVKDANGCVGTITGQTHAVEVQSKPTIEDVVAPPTVCETADFPIANPAVDANGSTITAQTWLLDGAPINMPFDLSRWYDGLPVKYRVTYTCGSNSSAYAYSNEVPLSIKPKNIATNPGMTQIHCNNGTFVMNAEAPTREDAWGTWSVYSGTATIVDPHSPTTTITDVPLNSRVVLEWSINNGVCPAASSAMYVENNDCASVNITAGAAPVVCDGSKATFTFTVRNGSPVATSNVTSTITLGAGLSDVKFTPSKGTISGNTWTISSMASGAEVVLTVVATVTTTDPTISVVINKAAGVELSDVQASQSATVNAKPTAAFTAASSEVCADAAELTNAQVTFTGASAFDLTYKVNGGAAITKTGLTSPYIIEEQLGANGTLQLVSVKDANGCVGTITGQNHTVVADYFPTIQDITKPATICEGNALSLTAPSVEANGSTLGASGWVLNGASFDPSTILSANQDAQDLKYSVAYTCGRQAQSTIYSNVVSIAVDANPSAAVAGAAQTQCNNGTFTLAATAPAVGEGTWTLTSGSGTIADASSATSQVTDVPVNGSATLKWTVSNGVCPATNSSVVLTNNDCTNLNLTAGAAPVVCDGSQATFTFTMKNDSPVASTNVTATITLGAGLSDVDVTPSMGSVSGNTWTIPSMASGEQAVLTVLATATTANATVSVVVNEASSVAVTGVQASQTATVNALPTAAFQSNRSEVCADAAELTNAQVTFTGASAFDLTYKVNGGAAITKTGLTSPYIIEEQLGANGTLQLVSVKDANGCVGTITGQNHTVVADYFPTIQDITKPATICEGNALSLTAPSVEANGSTLGASGWVLNGASFDPSTILSANQDAQDLKYSVAYTCGRQAQSTIYSNVVSIAVDANPSAAVAGAAQTQCNNGTFTLAATAPAVGEGTWTLTSGSGTIADASSATSQVTDVPVNGSATLKWTVSNGVCPATNSSVVLTNNDCTNLNLTAGAAPVVCDGSQATFTFTMKNDSPVASTNVTATITLGAGLSDVDVTPSMGSVSGNTWTIPSMASGEQAVLTVLATATTANATVSVVVNEASSVAVTGVQASQSATVNALPTAAFQSNSSTICIDPQDKELTNIAVNFTGVAPFELTYVDSKGSTYVENNLPLSATLLNADLDADEAYTLVSVTDANGCVGTITGQTHQVSTQKHASLDVLVTPAPVCEGNTLTLVAPAVINNNGAIVSNEKWFLDGREFDATTSVTHDVHNGKALFYQITSSCNAIERNIASNSVDVTVYKTPELTVAFADPKGNAVTATQITCAVPYLTATLSGAESYTWSDGSTDNPRTLGKKGAATTYEVSGVTAAGCVSAPLTFTVTEDFVVPDVTLSSSNADNILTCSVTEITLTASSNTTGVTYKWDDANETTGATLLVNQPNTYMVTATNPSNGCYAAATETIGINKEDPIVSIASVNASGVATKTITCTNTELTLTPSVSNETIIGAPVTFTWADDATLDAQRGVTAAGTYTVTAKGANGCEASVFVDIALDDNVPDLTLTASADTLTCADPVVVLQASVTTLQGVTYVWNTQAAQDSIHVRLGGEYSVTATAPNGCQKEASIVIEQRTDEPAVVITAADPKQYCRVNTLTADGAVSYVWSTNEKTTSIEVSEGGEYWVEGTNAYGCSARAELNLENDKEAPVVAISSDINAITCTNDVATLTATITNADDTRTYSYEWSPKSGTNSTLSVTEGKTYKVVVTDGTNYCTGEKTIAVAQHTEKPMVDVKTLPAVCLPATIDLAQAIGPNTLADNVVFYEDEALTQEITNTTIDLAQYNVFYVQGQQVNGNGCMGDAQPLAANVKAVTPAPVVKDYDECTKAGSEKFSSLVTSGYYKLNFYASENDEAPIADAFDASQSNTTTTYYVSNTNLGACESQRVPFSVHIEGLVDFEMEVSETEIMIGDDPVTITLIPSSVDVEGYRWMANGKELQVEGEEYTVPVYVDTKFEIAASGRCNSLTQEASVVVNWPTAFTPYNNNGMNETFAKGLPVLIFNRFGIQVFEGADGWDGVMNKNMGANVMAVPGVYYYAVSLPDGNVKKGTIEIVKF